MTRSHRAWLLLSSALFAFSAIGCGNSVFLLVTVQPGSGLTGAEQYTALSVTVNAGGASSTQEVTGDGAFALPTTFSAELAGDTVGSVTVTVAGLDGFAVIGVGAATVTILDTDFTSVTVVLSADDLPVCGDGTLEPPEECDDGNTTNGDGCSSACGIEPLTCGDGVCDMPGGETCTNCVSDCSNDPACAAADCGDGILDPGEECDDGNNTNGDGCSATCVTETLCGNAMVDPGEECDDGNGDDSDDCPGNCLNASCGDGFVWAGMEECDGDPMTNSDGCYANCTMAGPIPAIGLFNSDFGNLLVHGAAPDDHLGVESPWRHAVASGDLNGDGIDDLVVGAAETDRPGLGLMDAGAAYVIFGRDFDPDGNVVDTAGSFGLAPDAVVLGADNQQFLGFAVAIGEVTGDAFDDLVVAAPAASPGGRFQAGIVYIIEGGPGFGGMIDLVTTPAHTEIWGGLDEDILGVALAVGNVTGGGAQADLILGAPQADGPGDTRDRCGDVYVFAGPAPGGVLDLGGSPAPMPTLVIYGADNDDNAGFNLAVGNVDGDAGGYADLLVGVPGSDGPGNSRPEAGGVAALFGGASLAGTVDLATVGAADVLFHGGNPDDGLGAIATGDVNGDGIDDLLLGAPLGDDVSAGIPDAGAAYLWLGRASWPAVLDVAGGNYELELFGALDSALGGSGLGTRIALADVDASGTVDVVSAASNYADPLGPGTLGVVVAVLNPPVSIGGTVAYSLDPFGSGSGPDVRILPPLFANPGAPMGGPDAIGDLNNDGYPDLAISGPVYDSAMGTRSEAGLVAVYFAGPGAPVPPGACGDGVDNDGDGMVDIFDPGCTGFSDPDERTGLQCDDGMDNDGDGDVDFPNDPGCPDVFDDDETDPPTPPQCADGIDNDGDGATDYPNDTSCASAAADSEFDCLMSFEPGQPVWTWTNTCGSTGWTLSSFRSTDGPLSLYYGDPTSLTFDCFGSASSGLAESPFFMVSAGAALLTFDFWCETEGGSTWDITTLNVLDGGGTSTFVWDRNMHPVAASGSTGGVFVPITVDLSPFAGQMVRLQFAFDTIDAGGNSGEGVYIDNLFLPGSFCP